MSTKLVPQVCVSSLDNHILLWNDDFVIICHCCALNDRAVKEKLLKGSTPRSLLRQCCPGTTKCGGCLPELERIETQVRLERQNHEK